MATIQARTESLLSRSATAMTDMLDAIRQAQAAGATAEQLTSIFEMQKKSMWRLDFISADQEAARILGELIDYSRQAEVAATELRAPAAPEVDQSIESVQGVTPTEKAPIAPVKPRAE